MPGFENKLTLKRRSEPIPGHVAIAFTCLGRTRNVEFDVTFSEGEAADDRTLLQAMGKAISVVIANLLSHAA